MALIGLLWDVGGDDKDPFSKLEEEITLVTTKPKLVRIADEVDTLYKKTSTNPTIENSPKLSKKPSMAGTTSNLQAMNDRLDNEHEKEVRRNARGALEEDELEMELKKLDQIQSGFLNKPVETVRP